MKNSLIIFRSTFYYFKLNK